MRHFRDLQDYQLRMCLAEIQLLKGADCHTQNVWRMPHMRRILMSPPVVWLARHAQQSIWTTQGALRRIKRSDPFRQERRQVGARSVVDAPSRIYIDVTATMGGVGDGGIRRTVVRLVEEAGRRGGLTPVVADGERLRVLRDGADTAVELKRGDIYFMFDHFYRSEGAFEAVCDQAHAVGATCVVCIYDVIPLTFPALIDHEFSAVFEKAFSKALTKFDHIVTISAAAANDIHAYIAAHHADRLPKRISWFHLGADFSDRSGRVRGHLAEIVARAPTFVSVGSVLPHKGHLVALAAFEALWQAGHDVQYVIIGRPNASSNWVSDAIRQHRAFGTRLHWLQDANDAEVQFAYRNAVCMLQPSVAEGFGLPVVEALSLGTPIIASDLAIFREIAGDAITFFPPCDSRRLAECIAAHVASPKAATVDPRVPIASWTDSLSALLQILEAPLGDDNASRAL